MVIFECSAYFHIVFTAEPQRKCSGTKTSIEYKGGPAPPRRGIKPIFTLPLYFQQAIQ